MVLSKLSSEQLYKKCNVDLFPVEGTKKIASEFHILGQKRVIDAFDMAINVKGNGYNVFAMGENGLGQEQIIKSLLKRYANKLTTPLSWVYVCNFQNLEKPVAISFPINKAKEFKKDMSKLINSIKILLPSLFSSVAYNNKINGVNQKYTNKQNELLIELQSKAELINLTILKKDGGLILVPLNAEKEPLTEEDISKLSPEEKNQVLASIKVLQKDLTKFASSLPIIEREKEESLNEEKLAFIQKELSPYINKLQVKWADNKKVIKHLDGVEAYLQSICIALLVHQDSDSEVIKRIDLLSLKELDNLQVNIIVEYHEDKRLDSKKDDDYFYSDSAPVIVLDNPNFARLFGKIEYDSEGGSLTTNFNLVKPGALHLANGGYLIINARKMLEIPWLWESLKHNIKTMSIDIMSDEHTGYASTLASISPEPIPLKVKIVLVGEPIIYHKLWSYDPEFQELFKIVADFDSVNIRNEDNIKIYSETISYIVEHEKLRDLDNIALGRIIEIIGKMSDSQKYLSANISKITNILREANYVADKAQSKLITAEHLTQASILQKSRFAKFSEYYEKNITDEIISVKIKDEVVGQINGLSTISINDFIFGQPQRITCSVFPGKNGIIDVERNVHLSGSIHSKGIMILQGFLHSRFSKAGILSFCASVVFEQSYGGIDGDSASCAELVCLLSALTDTPIKQSLAITGSIDQKGNVQAIGGVNQKIEGFFNVAKQKGLTGEHGVVIPKSNVPDLMLGVAIREAVESGLFHIYSVENIDDALSIMTSKSVGELDKNTGIYPEGSINDIVVKKWVKTTTNVDKQ